MIPLINTTVVVPSGSEGARCVVSGKYVKIVSCSVASVLMGFDGGNTERVYPDDCYAGPDGGFSILRFVSDLGACNVVIQVSQQPVLGGSAASLVPVQATLDSILAALLTPATRTLLTSTTIAKTGVGSTLVFAGNASRRKAFVQASIANNGKVWLATANTVTQGTHVVELLPGASMTFEDQVAIYGCSENGTETVHGYETE